MRQLERTVGLKDLTVAEMEGRLREMSATTFDGVFVWRISDFAKKRQDAIAGRAPAMFSPGDFSAHHLLLQNRVSHMLVSQTFWTKS